LVPISIYFRNASFLADLNKNLIEPPMNMLVIKKIEMTIILLKLSLSYFGVRDVRLGWRW
jgi:hypothetical protein